ncbi:MAG: LacI family DNA-binding transcriptional regulator [Anaerolineae bacterium]|jgi:DNA-binding LacI/PurR family transcriptional regulator
MRAPTMKDVAEAAGVSVATVSRVLSGSPHSSEDVRKRVLEAAEALQYRPDQVARSLRRRQTDLIGFVASSIENGFFTEVAHAAEQAARRRGYSLIVCNTDESPELEEEYVSILDRLLVAGIILAPAPGPGHHLQRFIDAGLPIVLVNRRLDQLGCVSITANDEEAAFMCVSSLIDNGRQRIAAVKGLDAISTTDQRLRGYRRALATADLIARHSEALEVDGKAHIVGGYEATCSLMRLSQPPDAIFAFNNLMTQGAIMALHDLGVQRPEQVEVAGFGPATMSNLYRPPLTIVAQPTHQMGECAVETLLDLVAKEAPDGCQAIILQNKLVTPASTALSAEETPLRESGWQVNRS